MANERMTLLEVDGMTCGSCVRHVNAALASQEGVREIEVRIREGRVLVRHDADRAPVATLIEVLSDAGYDGVEAGSSQGSD